MGKQLDELTPYLTEFISQQKVFFVATAADEGRVNVSPKGLDSLRVISPNKVTWLNLTGSGNETAAHLIKNNRITLMFCAFEGKPLILRLYGTASVFHQRDEEFQKQIILFPDTLGARQIIEVHIEMVQTSCGFAVPFMDFKEDRTLLKTWAEKKEGNKLEEYWKEKNSYSIDNFETKILG